LANLVGLDMLIKDGSAKVTANLKFLNSVTLNKTYLLLHADFEFKIVFPKMCINLWLIYREKLF